MLILSCSERSTSKEFDYGEAVTDLQNEIQKMEVGSLKNHLLWKTQRILERDTLYNFSLDHNEYDSLKYALIWEEYIKYPMRQLNLTEFKKIEPQDNIEAYKFHYLRSFSRETVMITISEQLNGLRLLKSQVYWEDRNCNPIVGSKKLDGSCFIVKFNQTKEISEFEWKRFKELINELDYWNLEEDFHNRNDILDGSDWTIEGTKFSNDTNNIEIQLYKKVYRVSPKENSPSYKLGKFLLDQNEYEWGEIY